MLKHMSHFWRVITALAVVGVGGAGAVDRGPLRKASRPSTPATEPIRVPAEEAFADEAVAEAWAVVDFIEDGEGTAWVAESRGPPDGFAPAFALSAGSRGALRDPAFSVVGGAAW